MGLHLCQVTLSGRIGRLDLGHVTTHCSFPSLRPLKYSLTWCQMLHLQHIEVLQMQNAGIKKIHECSDQEDPWTQGSRRPMNSGIKKTHEHRDQEDPWMQWSGTSMNAGNKKIHECRDQEDPWMQGLRGSTKAGIRKINEHRDQEDQLAALQCAAIAALLSGPIKCSHYTSLSFLLWLHFMGLDVLCCNCSTSMCCNIIQTHKV